jgi:DNA-directed RNA polymerase specialized sigma24 family protein
LQRHCWLSFADASPTLPRGSCSLIHSRAGNDPAKPDNRKTSVVVSWARVPGYPHATALREKNALVNQAIAGLPADLREALLLFTVENLSQAEIATTLGCSAKAVEVRIYRARQALKAALASRIDFFPLS